MDVTVEFSGISRVLTRKRRVVLNLEAGDTFRDVLCMLVQQYPELAGEVINPDDCTLAGANMVNLNGERMLQEDQWTLSPQDGDHLILMSVLAGG
jgi:molybdopterin converting factor small subunit